MLRPSRRLGIALVTSGILTIVVAVIVVLEVANGPGTGPKSFATRRSYDQVKVAVHGSFPLAFLVGLAGLGLALLGARYLEANRTATERPGEGPQA